MAPLEWIQEEARISDLQWCKIPPSLLPLISHQSDQTHTRVSDAYKTLGSVATHCCGNDILLHCILFGPVLLCQREIHLPDLAC